MGRKSALKDTDGIEYIDFICGLGTNLFGYGNNRVNSAISKAIAGGISHSLPTTKEGECAERLTELFPFVEKFKFLCTGSEVCSAAIRMARSYTGRSKVLSEGYHGWSDAFVSLTPPADGVPKHPDMSMLKPDFSNLDEDTAAVIIEPFITDTSEARIAWLKALRSLCTKRGIVLIFDEVITGFRYRNHSVSQDIKVIPDLICLGKAMGSGIPIAAVAGNTDILDGDYFVSSTNAGSVAGLAAAIAAVDLLGGVPSYNINRLWDSGKYFLKQFNKLHPGLTIEGYPTRGAFKGDDKTKALFFQECAKSGILFGPSWFFNFDHVHDMDFVLDSCAAILERIKRDEITLEGMMPTSAFAEKARK